MSKSKWNFNPVIVAVAVMVIGSLLGLGITTASMNSHMDDEDIHQDFKDLSEIFVTREIFELRMDAMMQELTFIRGAVAPEGN